MRYQVIVGNIGTVCDTDQFKEAIENYSEYKTQSESSVGRAAGESVVLFDNDEIKWEHVGLLASN